MDELSRTALQELDLSREAMHTAYIHEQMAADPIDHYAPRVYRDLSGRTVLTLERIRGVTVREMLAATTNGNGGALAAWAARGITPRRTAVILLRSVLEQTMRYRSFNADPHPSNLIVSDGGTLNWVDFGAVGWIDERQWDQQMRLRDAIAQEQIHRRLPRPARRDGAAAHRGHVPVRAGDQGGAARLRHRLARPRGAAQPEEHGGVPAEDAGDAAAQRPADDVEHRAALPDDPRRRHRHARAVPDDRLARSPPPLPARPVDRPAPALDRGSGHVAVRLVSRGAGAAGRDGDDGVGHAPAARHRPPDAAHALGRRAPDPLHAAAAADGCR